jgi:hypothetical protein
MSIGQAYFVLTIPRAGWFNKCRLTFGYLCCFSDPHTVQCSVVSPGYRSVNIFSDPDHSIIKEKVRLTLISTVLRLLFDFLSSKADVNVASKSNKKKT